jgi:hypothetical protein
MSALAWALGLVMPGWIEALQAGIGTFWSGVLIFGLPPSASSWPTLLAAQIPAAPETPDRPEHSSGSETDPAPALPSSLL